MTTTEISKLIEAEPDVKRLVELAVIGTGWLYLIETPFETWPRFVIGTLSPDGSGPRILLNCGQEWSARAEWHRVQKEL